MSLVDTLKDAHIYHHRVSHPCTDLTEEEEVIYAKLKKERKRELTAGGLTAWLEPKRFGVNWRRELLKAKGEAYVQRLADEAKARTDEAKEQFEREAPNWRRDTDSIKRLVVLGPSP